MRRNYIDLNIIPPHITHIKIDIGLGMHNIHSKDWLKNDKNLCVFMFEPNRDCIESSTQNMLSIKDEIDANNNMYRIIPVALSNVNHETTMNFLK